MAKRKIGDAIVRIAYHDSGDYRGTITAGGKVWHFADLHAPPCGLGAGVAYDSPEAYDAMAQSAVCFGSYYTSHNRGDDCPEWAPDAETADAIDEAIMSAADAEERGTYTVKRLR